MRQPVLDKYLATLTFSMNGKEEMGRDNTGGKFNLFAGGEGRAEGTRHNHKIIIIL